MVHHDRAHDYVFCDMDLRDLSLYILYFIIILTGIKFDIK